jgi:hypothetical protein
MYPRQTFSNVAHEKSRRHFSKRPNRLTLGHALDAFHMVDEEAALFFKLIAPRATFPRDMTDKEKVLMDEHSAYCEQQFEAGKLLLYGPVMDGAFRSFRLGNPGGRRRV